MKDSAHDKEHIYRVLYTALEIAESESNVNFDILISACLLHDIGRPEQFENPKLCHAEVGAKKAYDFLIKNGYEKSFAKRVHDCINSHRFRGGNKPESIEAKILFDADKLDVTGTLGIARTLVYNGAEGEPLYSLDEKGYVLDGTGESEPSFFQEYKFKLEKIYDRFYTEKGKEIAQSRRSSAESFYNNMLFEVRSSYEKGLEILDRLV